MISTVYTPNTEHDTNEYYLDRDHLNPVHWIDEELDPDTETVYLFSLSGFGNTPVYALYSGFTEQEAFDKIQELPARVQSDQIARIAEAKIVVH